MKKKVYPSLLLLALLFISFSTSTCNKPFTPPNMVGTWTIGTSIGGSVVESFISFDRVSLDRLNNLDAAQLLSESLKTRITDAATATNISLRDLRTITFFSDGTFTFTFETSYNAQGTYTQDGSYIFFTCATGHFPEVDGFVLGISDGSLLEVYPSTLTLMPIFMNFLDIDSDERELLFGNPLEPVISGMEAIIYFTHNSFSY